jgi:hypothetical protein
LKERAALVNPIAKNVIHDHFFNIKEMFLTNSGDSALSLALGQIQLVESLKFFSILKLKNMWTL